MLESVEKKFTEVFPDLQGKLQSDQARLVALPEGPFMPDRTM